MIFICYCFHNKIEILHPANSVHLVQAKGGVQSVPRTPGRKRSFLHPHSLFLVRCSVYARRRLLMDYRISLVGLFIGFLVGLTGMGGGSLLAPIMILIFRIPPVWAVSTDIAYSTVTKAVGSIVHIRQKNVNFKVALWLACGSVPATILSITLVQYIRKHYGTAINGIIIHSIGFTLILVAVLLVLKPYIMRRLERKNLEARKQESLEGTTAAHNRKALWEKRYRPIVTALVGAVVG